MMYHTSQGVKRLIAVDCVIFGYEIKQLKLLLFKRHLEPAKGEWSLIGGWVHEDESVEGAARRVLRALTGLKNIFLDQVGIFSEPNRDPGGNVLSVAFNALIKIEKHSNEMSQKLGAKWFPIEEVPPLIFDHDDMFKIAFDKLRLKATYELVGRQLLPEKFTILQMRDLYNQIFQKEFDPSNFRKKILSLKILKRLDEKKRTGSKRGAYYYQFKEEKNQEDQERQSEPIFRLAIQF